MSVASVTIGVRALFTRGAPCHRLLAFQPWDGAAFSASVSCPTPKPREPASVWCTALS